MSDTGKDIGRDIVDATDEDAANPAQAADVAVEDVEEHEPPTPEPDPDAVAVVLNGHEITARKGELVIATAERHGVPIPHFCYHPRMSSVGMCRQCIVEIDTGRGPQLQPSCMITVSPDMRIDTVNQTVKAVQEGMLELMLANHPLDCPVCDKGGECPLQDQAFAYGPGESRYVEQKRHYEKPIPISDLVNLDRERCILCDRCTRFADEVAGDKLIHFTQRGNATQVMTFPDEPFASYFSGNTVQICPVGALTSQPYRFKARPWDLAELESTCTTCAVGCRIVVQSSRDELLRYQGVDSDPVNHGWLCDRGRFNFEAVNSDHRLTEPMIRTGAGLTGTNWNTAMTTAAQLLRDAMVNGPARVAVLGGARGTNEDAFAWGQFADAIDTPWRDAQLGDGLPAQLLGLPRATIDQAANASTIILMGPDLKEALPVLYLRLRDASEKGRSRIIEVSATDTGLTRYAWKSVRHEPGRQAEAVARACADPDVVEQLASGDVVVVAGRANLAESADVAVAGLLQLLDAVPEARVLPALRRGNVVGALSLGMAPTADGDRRNDAIDILNAAADGTIDVLILVGADPLNDCPDAHLARRALAGARRIISLDTHPSESTNLADVVLPAAAYGEKAGTTTNLEGRVSTLAKKVTAAGTSRPDWMVAVELGAMIGVFDADHPLSDVTTVDEITDLISDTAPLFPDVTRQALAHDRNGVMSKQPAAELPAVSVDVAPRNSYDYRVVVGRRLYDRAVGTAMSRSLAKLAPGAAAHLHPLDIERAGVEAGTDVKLIGASATVVLPVVADSSVPRGVLFAPFNQSTSGGNIEDLIDAKSAVTDVRIERI